MKRYGERTDYPLRPNKKAAAVAVGLALGAGGGLVADAEAREHPPRVVTLAAGGITVEWCNRMHRPPRQTCDLMQTVYLGRRRVERFRLYAFQHRIGGMKRIYGEDGRCVAHSWRWEQHRNSFLHASGRPHYISAAWDPNVRDAWIASRGPGATISLVPVPGRPVGVHRNRRCGR